tara:strand:+ start:7542 stop:8981 length:1440 start_codon:yes stop_codon:yes gene_type:complete
MAVVIQDLESILKEFYLGPIIEALNSQLEMVQLFSKVSLDWSGRKVVIPVHVSRNTGTGYRSETAGLPTAGKQGYVDLNVTAKYLYGRFALTGPAIATAKTTAHSFATYVQSEMDGVVTDTKLIANQAMYTGGGAVGFIWEKADITASAGVALQSKTFRFTGNKDILRELQNLDPGLAATRRTAVDIVRLDTYASAVTLAAASDAIITDADAAATIVAGGTGDSELYLESIGGATLTLSTLTGNFAAMVVVQSSGQYTPRVAGPPIVDAIYTPDVTGTSAALRVLNEPSGIYQNLGSKLHFTVDRSIAANAPLRSTIQCIDGTNAAPQKLNFGRMQNMLDEIMIAGGEDPQCIYVHPGMRQEYASLLSFQAAAGAPTTFRKDVQGGAGKGDPGYSAYSFNNIPVKVSRHCGKGLAIFLNTKVWNVAELHSFGMADADGNVLSRVPGFDQWEGFVKWYYELVCKNPNHCAMLIGVEFPGM